MHPGALGKLRRPKAIGEGVHAYHRKGLPGKSELGVDGSLRALCRQGTKGQDETAHGGEGQQHEDQRESIAGKPLAQVGEGQYAYLRGTAMNREAAEYNAMRTRLRGTTASWNMSRTVQNPKAPSITASMGNAAPTLWKRGAITIKREALSMEPSAAGFAQGWQCRGTMRRAKRVAATPKAAKA